MGPAPFALPTLESARRTECSFTAAFNAIARYWCEILPCFPAEKLASSVLPVTRHGMKSLQGLRRTNQGTPQPAAP